LPELAVAKLNWHVVPSANYSMEDAIGRENSRFFAARQEVTQTATQLPWEFVIDHV
jgi:hypothetical protein